MLIVTRNPDFIFIHNPKAGGRYLAHILRHILEPKDGIQFLESPFPTHMTLAELEKDARFQVFNAEAPNPTVVLCVIRNPWARMWSFYKYIASSTAGRIADRLSGAEITNSIDHETDLKVMQEMQELTFSDWILRTRGEALVSGLHVPKRDQFSFVETPVPNREIVCLKYEKLGLSNPPQLNRLGINIQDIGFQHSASADYQEHYTPEAREFVEYYFQRDIELFDYRF